MVLAFRVLMNVQQIILTNWEEHKEEKRWRELVPEN
jgi:hypothetical protein